MKQLSSLFFFFLVFSPTFAQKEDTWSIKVYHNTDIYNKQYINATGERNESVFQPIVFLWPYNTMPIENLPTR
jgi:hypothetical protein